jgi:hypothetical protein
MVSCAAVLEGELHPNWVGEAYAFFPDSRALCRAGPGGALTLSPDPLSPVVIAFQGMVQDGLMRRARPVSAVYGERVLALVPGRLAHVGAVLRGRPDPLLRGSMEGAARAITEGCADALVDWPGGREGLECLAGPVGAVVARTSGWGPGEVEDPMRARGVFPVTAVDFEGGCARFKVGVFSAGLEGVQDARAELSYGRDLLRLTGAHPPGALDPSGALRVGAIPQGEAGSVAALLEPLAVGRALVEGTLTFFGKGSAPRHLELPRRHVEVEGPSAQGRPLAEGGPVAPSGPAGGSVDTATRAWHYPAGLGAVDVVRVSRTALGTRGLELGPGSRAPGPPPSWTVEAGAVHGRTPLWVALTIVGGDERLLTLRVGSTDPAMVAWAVAEMRTQLQEAFFRRWRGLAGLEEVAIQGGGVARAPLGGLDELISVR